MKNRLLILVLFLLCFYNSSQACENSVADDYFDIAVNYFNDSKGAKALDYLGYALQLEPDSLKANTLKNRIIEDNLLYNNIKDNCEESSNSQ
jgi:hypothetical protein